MMQARRDKLKGALQPNQIGHAGLILSRYLATACEAKSKEFRDSRDELYRLAPQALQAAFDVYDAAFSRWKKSLPPSVKCRNIMTRGRLVIGLGAESVLETGITLHHTYGTPIIRGTALKGLANHYCQRVWGETDSRFRKGGEFHRVMFGATMEGGLIDFADAWILPDSLKTGLGLDVDVLTPHHSKYNQSPPETPPTDFDDPIPVNFLSLRGSFLVAVSADRGLPDGSKWTDLVFTLLEKALDRWGIGGKTSSGYGRMTVEPNPAR